MKIFLTGGTGFIGSYFLALALKKGHEVIALRRSESSGTAMSLSQEPTWLTCGFEDLELEHFEGVDVLVHLAAQGVSPKPADWESCFDFNVIATLRIAKLAHEAGVARFVSSGTYAEYGLSGSRYERIPNNAPLEPVEPYAASKAAAGLALASFTRNMKWQSFYGRIFSAFGEGQFEKNFWPQLKSVAESGEDFPMTEGAQIRDFIPVEEVARIFLTAAVERDLESGVPVIENVASGMPVTLKDFASEWWTRWGATGDLKLGAVPYRTNEVMTYIPEVP